MAQILEANLNYINGTVKFSFGTRVTLGPATTEIVVTVYVKRLVGRLMFIVPPYPFGRHVTSTRNQSSRDAASFALSFVDDPELLIDVQFAIGKNYGSSLSALPSRVRSSRPPLFSVDSRS